MILRIRLPVGPSALAHRLRLPLLRALCVLCFVGGLACLTLYADIYFDARAFQRQSLAQLSAAAAESAGRGAKPRAAPPPGCLLGKLEIPRLELSIAILSGTDEATLLRGIGHIDHTAALGEVGNVGIAGHRDTFFRPLKDIRIRDEIVVATPNTTRVYLVSETMIVDPEDVFVLAPEVGDALTLVTCYPFYYVGKAPRRFIVRALPKVTGGNSAISGDGGGG